MAHGLDHWFYCLYISDKLLISVCSHKQEEEEQVQPVFIDRSNTNQLMTLCSHAWLTPVPAADYTVPQRRPTFSQLHQYQLKLGWYEQIIIF